MTTTEPFRYDDVRGGAPGEVGAPGEPGSVEEFRFEPIKGYPMLQWRGKRPFTSTRYYPAQLKEVHGAEVEGWRSRVYWGDNLQVMGHMLRENRSAIRLIYLDPPFDSGASYGRIVKRAGNQAQNDSSAFEEKQYQDIWANDEYLQYMYERIILMRELLAPNGTLWLHCDPRRGHLLRCVLDEVFGDDLFVNTIHWRRSLSHGDTGQGARHFGRTTDYIHVYSNQPDYFFEAQYVDYSDDIIARDYKYTDDDGSPYRLMPVDGPGGAEKGNPYYEFMGVRGYFRYSRQTMQQLYDNGEIIVSSTGKTLHRKRFLRDAKGTPVTDLWSDLNRISPTASERLGYPTQKPEALLERIVRTASGPGDLVFDCFMGSGTTQAVAMKLGRRFIGADINLGAVQITTKRLIQVAHEIESRQASPARQAALDLAPPPPTDDADSENASADAAAPPELTTFYTGFEVYNVNHYDVFRNPVEAKELLLDALEVHRLAPGALFDGEKDGRMVKIMPVNRIATRQDLNELITGLDYRALSARAEQAPNQPVERITLICMGHEPDLAATLVAQLSPLRIDVEVVDILRDRQDLQFKRDSEARIVVEGGELVIAAFYPMNLLGKLSLQKESVEDWRELVESVMIDWNYDGAVLQPAVVDIPVKDQWVAGRYPVPAGAGTARVKITDLLSESLEQDVRLG